MSKPLLSICVPTYHRGETAYKSIKKILEHDVDYIEVVASDNASPDNTQELLSQIKDPRFKYYRNDTNIGAPNINTCVLRGTGKWCILVSDEDTIYKPDWERLKHRLENSEDVGLFKASSYDSDGNLLDSGPIEKRYPGTFEAFQFIVGYFKYLCGVTFRRGVAEKYFNSIDTSTSLYYSYVYLTPALYYAQDWAVEALPEISTIMGKESDFVHTDKKTVKLNNGIITWGHDGKVVQQKDLIDVWMKLKIDDSVRQRLILKTGISLIKNISNLCESMYNDNILQGSAVSQFPDRIKEYRELDLNDWNQLISDSLRDVESKMFDTYNGMDQTLVTEYREELSKVLDERMNRISEVLKTNGKA